jgi:hypothetical protein
VRRERSEGVKHRLERTETTETIPEADIFMAEDRLGSSTQKALAAAERWIKEPKDHPAVTTEAEEGGEEENE